jgi:sugar phosphate isomerase/epimerase
MTRLVFHAGSCWPVPLDETMRQAAAVGYAGIELAPHPLFLPPAHWSAEDAGRLRDAATDAGLVIASLDLGHAALLGAIPFEPSLMAPHGQQRDRRIRLLRQAIEFASELSCPLVPGFAANAARLRHGTADRGARGGAAMGRRPRGGHRH